MEWMISFFVFSVCIAKLFMSLRGRLNINWLVNWIPLNLVAPNGGIGGSNQGARIPGMSIGLDGATANDEKVQFRS